MGKVYYRVLVAVAMAMAALHVSAQELMVATDRPGELEEKVGAVADGISSLSVEGLIDFQTSTTSGLWPRARASRG